MLIGILCSGGLGFSILEKLKDNYNVQFVLTDSKSTLVRSFCKEQGIPCFSGNPRNGKGKQFIKNYPVDVIASINYLFLIEKDIINHPSIFTFNIHGSLLPKYRGRTPHVWAIINGEKKTGITAHIINEGCDTGEVIHQIEVPINDEDTGATILKKYEVLYHPLIEKVFKNIQNNNISLTQQDESQATYFGKRTPLDGEIDWSFTSEQIRNWVRAQAYPYPGAFTFYEGDKIIIDKVSIINKEYSKNYKVGEIVAIDPKIIVKSIDGFFRIDELREEKSIFEIGKRFEYENRR